MTSRQSVVFCAVTAMSIRSMSNRAAECVNPLVFGLLSLACGVALSFAVMGVLTAVFAGVLGRRLGRNAKQGVEAQLSCYLPLI